jgi:hypothetical protein
MIPLWLSVRSFGSGLGYGIGGQLSGNVGVIDILLSIVCGELSFHVGYKPIFSAMRA